MINHTKHSENIRLWYSLIFFLLCSLFACRTVTDESIHIIWKDRKAIAVSIPVFFTENIPADSIAKLIKISLEADSVALFGQFKQEKTIVFEPVIPFSAGKHYMLWVRNQPKTIFTEPVDSAVQTKPSVVAVYPLQDSLPENTLKIYIRFSEPMQEGQSDKYIKVIMNNHDTLHNTFLDLKPELWNEDRTVLTLWLDPGRIKRGLQPNLKMGNPLQEKNHYTISIDQQWKDANGDTLGKNYIKNFVATTRDNISPVPDTWTMLLPKAGTQQPLQIGFHEVLDHFLLEESLHIITSSGEKINGKWATPPHDDAASFVPDKLWTKGDYFLVVDTKLEDLCGNNINKPFDRDITKTKTPSDNLTYRRRFAIGN